MRNPASACRCAAARLGVILLTLLFVAQSAWAQQCPAIGAIRWDAWHGKDSAVGKHVEEVLAPKEWRYRIPFCGKELPSGQVEIECDNPQAMAKEIEYARAAQLTYWAFELNAPDNALSLSLKYYLAVPPKDRINFALIAGGDKLTPSEIERIVQYMRDANYQKVQSNRPLFFVRALQRVEGQSGLREVLQELRARAKAAGLANPYLVGMEPNPERAARSAKEFGLDAISTYSTRSGKAGAPYENLSRATEKYWERSKGTGAQVVPIVMTGWDNRPRAAAPSAAQKKRRPEKLGMFYYDQGKPEQIAAHVADAIRWVRQNPGSADANAVIIYAWNEFDEGGWLAPTLSEGAARVQAMGAAVGRECRRR